MSFRLVKRTQFVIYAFRLKSEIEFLNRALGLLVFQQSSIDNPYKLLLLLSGSLKSH